MAVDPKGLKALAQPQGIRRFPLPVVGENGAPLPKPSGVVYAHPNPDGSRKNCYNCYAWVRTTNQCLIHRPDMGIYAQAVCGYHVYGTPREEWIDMGVDPVDPDISGLTMALDGTACEVCRWFGQMPTGGACHAVADPNTGNAPVPVESLGCCARWEKRND